MFQTNDEAYILRRLERNEIMLVTGAGFSMMAENISGENLPTSIQFAKKIWKFLEYNGEYDLTPLTLLWDLVLNSGKPSNRISSFITDSFKVKEYPPIYKIISIPFWYKIYTLNVDNLLERVYEDQGKHIQVLKFPKDENSERDQSLIKTQIVHLGK